MSSHRTSRAEQRRRTQSRILAAAQTLFAEVGYDRATIRAIAAEANSDPGLVMRYFGSKENLFAQVAGFEPDQQVTGTPEQAAEQLLSALEHKLVQEPIEALAAIRSVFTHSGATDEVRSAMVARQRQAAHHMASDDADLRAGLIGAITIGAIIGRHLLQLDGLKDAAPQQVTALLRAAFHDVVHGATRGSADTADRRDRCATTSRIRWHPWVPSTVRSTFHRSEMMPRTNQWPSLRLDEWTATRDTVHMWAQIVGKIRMQHMPLINHWWQVPLYVSPRGLTTGGIPDGGAMFDIEFDFVDHVLAIRHSDGSQRTVALQPKSVADFYSETLSALHSLGVESHIVASPNEVDPAIPFAEDTVHNAYDPDAMRRFWQQLVQAHRVFTRFRASFAGKVSPVHFFWGAMDLACTRFSGRPAPRHPGGAPNCPDRVMVEGYSRELSSCGFWPGGGEEGAFYSYAYPQPKGFAAHPVEPDNASFSEADGEFLLPYEAVRTAGDPDDELMRFLQSTYQAAADLGRWDRDALECDPNRLSQRPEGASAPSQ